MSGGVMSDYNLKIESTVLSSPYSANSTDMTPIGGGQNYSTYRFDIPADNVLSNSGQEFWVIAEEKNYNYTNNFGVPNLANTDALAAFFRYPAKVSPTHTGCPVPKPSAINPNTHAATGTVICNVASSNLVGATNLHVYLDKSGAIDGTYDITGANITNVNVAAGTLDVTFSLTGVASGSYYVIITNSCGQTGVSDTPLFVVTDYLVGDYYVSNSTDFNGLPEEGTMAHPFHTINGSIDAAKTMVAMLT